MSCPQRALPSLQTEIRIYMADLEADAEEAAWLAYSEEQAANPSAFEVQEAMDRAEAARARLEADADEASYYAHLEAKGMFWSPESEGWCW